jgi:hypothetical protein
MYRVSGAAKMRLVDGSGTEVTGTVVLATRTGMWETLDLVFVPTANQNVRLQFVTDNGAGEFYVDTVSIIDGTTVERWQAFTYDNKGRTLTE